jgi:hypothetical protein
MLGKKHSEETKEKIRSRRIGTKASKETREKMSKTHKGLCSGKKHPNWKGGQYTDKDGRVYIYKPEHSYSNNKGYIFRSRLIMEEILGRYLNPDETVHHKNQILNDDRPENLELFESKGKHTAYHNRLKSSHSALKEGGFKLLTSGKKEIKEVASE